MTSFLFGVPFLPKQHANFLLVPGTLSEPLFNDNFFLHSALYRFLYQVFYSTYTKFFERNKGTQSKASENTVKIVK